MTFELVPARLRRLAPDRTFASPLVRYPRESRVQIEGRLAPDADAPRMA